MPTTNPEKNREYVRTSNMKKKDQIGEEEYNKYFANNQQKYRDNKKSTDEKAELYKKQQAEYMKQYRAKQKQEKQEKGKQEKGANTLINAWKAHKARKELQLRSMAKMAEDEVMKTTKRQVGRPKKPRNPVGRPKKQQ